MVLKEELVVNEQSRLNIELCFRTDELIKSLSNVGVEEVRCTLPFLQGNHCRFFHTVNENITGFTLPEADKTHMYWHLRLVCLTNQTLTEQEFKMFSNLIPIDYHIAECYWAHNCTCEVLFANGYGDIPAVISLIGTQFTHYEEIFQNTKWLLEMINRHQEIRTHFPFCEGCAHHTAEQCQFWDDVAQSLQSCLSLTNEAVCADLIRSYSAGLEIPCQIPQSLAELKKRYEEEW